MEVSAGTLMIAPAKRQAAVLVAMGLAVLFAGAGVVVRRIRVECGCFGSLLAPMPPLGALSVAIGMALLAAGAVVLSSADPGPSRTRCCRS